MGTAIMDMGMGSEPRIAVQMEGVNGTLEELKLEMA